MSQSNQWRLWFDLTRREINSRLSHSAVGLVWLVVTPLLLLSVYSFVFGVIFKARAPDGLGFPFVVWLAIGLWPWLAFSEGALRASGAIRQHSALISKIALNRAMLVIAVLTATFALQMAGYGVVLVVLELMGINLAWQGLPHAILILLTLYLLATGLGLMLAAFQVFIRDLEQLLPIGFMLWFFLTPILYAPEFLPQDLQALIWINPMTWWMEALRSALIDGQTLPDRTFVALAVGSGAVYLIGHWVFNRTSPYFEDFL
jgi:ABC-type polysaccharide/polyol phosphate export permease